MWLFLHVDSFDGCRVEDNHTIAKATVFGSAAPPPVLAEVAAAAAAAVTLPVFADAATAALFAGVALPPVLADATAAALLAGVALPPVRTGHGASCTPRRRLARRAAVVLIKGM